MKQTKVTRKIAMAMLLIAICFVGYAAGHPEAFFPWSTAVTHWIYRIYLVVTVVFFFI